jgi:hypothetical protein
LSLVPFRQTHYSNDPSFQHSNWGEAPKFYIRKINYDA